MKLLLIKTILIILTVIINNKNTVQIKETQTIKNDIIINNNSDILGTIKIEKIKLNKPLYDINNHKNNIEENVTILKESILPPNNNSIIFLAAHSGTSSISFFNNLNKLNINDEIILTIKNNKYIYTINKISKQKKVGYININKERKNQLILTTCDPTNNKYQLIISSTKKELK